MKLANAEFVPANPTCNLICGAVIEIPYIPASAEAQQGALPDFSTTSISAGEDRGREEPCQS